MRAEASTEPSAAAADGGTGRLAGTGRAGAKLMAAYGAWWWWEGVPGCLACMCMCVVLVCLLMGEGPVYSVFGCGRACTPRVMRHACGETVGAAGAARFWRVYQVCTVLSVCC